MMSRDLVEAARRRDLEWHPERHRRVRDGIAAGAVRRDRRKAAAIMMRTGLVGAAVFALALRAFGSPSDAPSNTDVNASIEIDRSPAHASLVAYGDAGFGADVMRD